ncbi:MAG: ABC-F family ATP-binding cassette domain-containing protein [Gudongella oleilytica]|jgi:ATP-binding cassette subfamily F protein uup|nr:ABC-F family ATP-binding cassette domain-containing protein [Gudongella oleilytica]
MLLMTIESVSKSYVERKLVEEISFGINEGDRVGLIGINGAGKSTLLKLLAGLEEPDSGRIIRASDAVVSYLPQNPNFLDENTVLDQVFGGHWERMRVLRDYERTISALDTKDDHIMMLTAEMDRLNCWELEADAKNILTRLGITDYNSRIRDLSGGQRKRVALATALIQSSDLLILDEPTNHLDNDTIEWLEKKLMERKGALFMVTHDRYFLDRVTNKIMELEGGSIYSYDGNFSYFMEKKLERHENLKATEEKKKALYKKELAWMRQGAKARTTKQKARIQRFETLEDEVTGGDSSESLDFSVGTSRLGKKIIEAKEVTKSIGGKVLVKDFTYVMTRGERLGILGANGTGKTTLLRLLSGELEPDSGDIQRGETLKIGFFKQETPFLDPEQRAIDYIREGGEFITTSDGQKVSASSMMERFLFPRNDHYTPVGKLSGGEQRRLYLLKILMESPNMLLLDEPTNDLDINTLQILEEYLDDFPGPVIIVSHDRYLLDKLAEKLLIFTNDGIKEFTGNYDLFRNAERQLEKEEAVKTKPEPKRDKTKVKANGLSFTELREWETIEERIAELELKVDEKLKEMEANSSDFEILGRLIKEKEILDSDLEKLMDRWMYLSSKADN